MSPVSRARLISAAKVIATVVLLALVLRKIPVTDLTARLGRVHAVDVLLLIAVMTVQVAFNAIRWGRLLRALGERVPYRSLFGDVCVGSLYNMLLPGSVGGDVIRALRAGRRVEKAHRAWSTSIYERMIGLFAMTAVGSLAVVLGLNDTVALPSWLRGATFALTLALALALAFASLPFRLLTRVLGSRLSAPARTDLAGIRDDLSGPLTAFSVRAEAFGWSLALQAMTLVFVSVAAAALGAPGHTWAIVVGVPIVIILSLAPITIGGHGLREGLYVGVLGALGMPGDVALGIAAAFLAANLFYALVGGAFLIFDRIPPPATS